MSAPEPRRAEVLFYEALALAPAERAAFLNEQCRADPVSRGEVEELLGAYEEAGGFLKEDAPVSPDLESQFARLKPEEVGERIGPYKLLEQIGEGGFGTVWVAEQEQPIRRRVALKIIKLGMDTKDVVARFEQERQALAMMDHPNIARVLDAGATPFGRPFFVMELVRGVKITEYCDQANLPTAERLQLFIAVCQAVQHAHQKGIIHRDLKPSNILVTLHDGVPVPKVIDFGVAKATQQQRLTNLTIYTQFEQMIGTPLYMSPEQAEMSGLDVDTRSDIYSLGVLLYELLTGKTPFDPEKLMKSGYDEMRRVIREEEPQKPSTRLSTMAMEVRTDVARHRHSEAAKLINSIKGDLDWIVMKALEKDRSRRYETANGLAMDIQRHLQSEPVLARPPSDFYRFRRFAKRNRNTVAASVAVLAALVVGLTVSTWMFLQEKRARERAVAAEQEQSRLRQLAVAAEQEQGRLRQLAEAAEKAQEQERKKAESEAGKSKQVAQFLQDMLKGVGPSVALGRDTKLLREILDKTAERVSKDLKDQPEVEAELRSAIGSVYDELGEYEQARAMYAEALAIEKRTFGDEHPAVAGSLNNLAIVLYQQGKLTEAETMYRESLTMWKKLLGNEHRDVATSLNNLAVVLHQQGKRAEAEAMHREALAMQRRLLGNEHPAVASSLNNLASMLRDEQAAEAEAMQREALAMQKKLLGNEHPAVATSLSNLSSDLSRKGKYAEAEATEREALAMKRKLFGDEHPDVAMSLRDVGTILGCQRKHAEAEVMHREALAMLRKLLGDEHPNVAIILKSLAIAVSGQGRWPEAVPMHREVLAMQRKLLGNEHPEVANSLSNLGNALVRTGELAEAEDLLREALTMGRTLLGNEHSDVIAALSRTLRRQGKDDEAKVLLSAEIASYRKSGKDLKNIDPLLEALADLLYRQSDFAAAEPIYREMIETRLPRLGAGAGKVLIAKASLARVLTDWALSERGPNSKIGSAKAGSSPEIAERAREAERLLRECLAIQQRGPNATDSRTTGENPSRLGAALLAVAVTDPTLTTQVRQAKFTEAERLLLEGHEVLQQAEKVADRHKRDSFTRLVRFYETTNKPAKAAAWRRKLAEFDKAAAEKLKAQWAGSQPAE